MKRTRIKPSLRKGQILESAITLSEKHGYHNVTRELIANHASVSVGLINNYFGTMANLRRTIMRAAIKQEIPVIVAQGVINNDKYADRAPMDLKVKASKIIMGA